MRIASRTLAALLALGLPALPAAASSRSQSNGQSVVPLSMPGPAQMLDQAREALAAGRTAEAASLLDAAQHRLITDSSARNLPQEVSAASLRRAIPVVDTARQALARQDVAAATKAVAEARALL